MTIDTSFPSERFDKHYLKHELDELLGSGVFMLSLFLADASSGIWFWDLEEPNIQWICPAFWTLLGFNPADKQHHTKSWMKLISGSELRSLQHELSHHCAAGTPHFEVELKFRHADGSFRWLRSKGLALRNERGNVSRCLILHSDITPLKLAELEALAKSKVIEQLQAEIDTAKADAKIALNAKSEFLSRMSHELRTPLNVIMGFAQIQKRCFDDDTKQQLVSSQAHIMDASAHLLMMIEDVLEIVSIEQDRYKLKVKVEEVELSKVVDVCFERVQAEAAAKGLRLRKTLNCPNVLADRERLTQVLMNLVGNAVKYNIPGGKVIISSQRLESGEVELLITDSGAGIDGSENIDLFQPFSRMAYAKKEEIQGVGVGLALSRHLVLQMNGDIGFSSNVGIGTIFWVRLPGLITAYPETTMVGEQAIKTDSFVERLTETKAGQASVLYIEDDMASRGLMEAMFNAFAMPVNLILASDAEGGIKLANKYRPELILVDINLPGMSGIDAMAILKPHPGFVDTRFIAVSVETSASVLLTAKASGFDDFLAKPLDFDLLLQEIQKMLATAKKN